MTDWCICLLSCGSVRLLAILSLNKATRKQADPAIWPLLREIYSRAWEKTSLSTLTSHAGMKQLMGIDSRAVLKRDHRWVMSTRPNDFRFQLSSRFTFKIFQLCMDYETTWHSGPHKLPTDGAGVWHAELAVQKLERGLWLIRNRQVSGWDPWSEFEGVVSVHTSWECPSISRGVKHCTASFHNVLELVLAD